ncbi:hypothetical protein BC937DRAFT_88838 [Endogone sp. FLAS-F59071]|nr:hypothetical protein BC937DRAFT_88838 [Endogone sp. FLAS-F59071]|eukprot:RUS18366.1 hypothetical protein BC937DRAFT_88838 [Endogone sp. FLAS-F59071]
MPKQTSKIAAVESSQKNIEILQAPVKHLERTPEAQRRRLERISNAYEGSYSQGTILLQAIRLNAKRPMNERMIVEAAKNILRTWEPDVVDPVRIYTFIKFIQYFVNKTTLPLSDMSLDHAIIMSCVSNSALPVVCPPIALVMATGYIEKLRKMPKDNGTKRFNPAAVSHGLQHCREVHSLESWGRHRVVVAKKSNQEHDNTDHRFAKARYAAFTSYHSENAPDTYYCASSLTTASQILINPSPTLTTSDPNAHTASPGALSSVPTSPSARTVPPPPIADPHSHDRTARHASPTHNRAGTDKDGTRVLAFSRLRSHGTLERRAYGVVGTLRGNR